MAPAMPRTIVMTMLTPLVPGTTRRASAPMMSPVTMAERMAHRMLNGSPFVWDDVVVGMSRRLGWVRSACP